MTLERPLVVSGEYADESRIDFHAHHPARCFRQELGHDSQARADLQDGFRAGEFRGGHDPVQCVLVQQKMLPQLLMGRHPVLVEESANGFRRCQIHMKAFPAP